MTENLIELLKSQLSGPIIEQIAKLLGLDVSKANAAVSTLAAALLGGLGQQAQAAGGLDQIMGLIRNQPADAGGDILSKLPDILGSPEKRGELEKRGTDLAGQVFGPNLGAILGTLGSVLGLGKAVIGPLLGLIGPLLMSIISKQILGKGLGAPALGELLKGQSGFLKGVLPPDLSKSLGFADLGGAATDAARRAAEYGAGAMRSAEDQARAATDAVASGLPGWLLPLLGLLALVLLGLVLRKYMMGEEEKPAEVTNNAPIPARSRAADPVVALPKETKTDITAAANLIDTALKADNFKTLTGLIEAAGLVDTLKGDGPFTVLAPTDTAFAKLSADQLDDLKKAENKDKLVEILKYHILPSKVTSVQAKSLDGQSVDTLAGLKLPVSVVEGALNVGGAKVTETDILSTNGLIQVIDTVLMPPAH